MRIFRYLSILILTFILMGMQGLFSEVNADLAAVQEDDAQSLVSQLLSVSGGAATSNEVVTQGVCSGTFTGGLTVDGGTNFNIDAGIILSSGDVAGVAPPNNSDNFSTDLGLPGDLFLDSLVSGLTEDACVLEFDFRCPAGSAGSDVAFRYNFASEEYNEFVNSEFNDVFGFQLNGTNIAVLPGSTTPVAINNVNNGLNAGFYNDNDPSDTAVPFAIQADGFVSTLTASGSANLPVNHIKMAIADRGDEILDSWIMMEGGSFECIVRVKMDIKPQSDPNCIKPNSRGVVSVAYFGSPDVDISTIDLDTLELAGALPTRCAVEDVPMTMADGTLGPDGIDDLVCKYKKADMDLSSTAEGCQLYGVSGSFIDGLKLEASDFICLIGDRGCSASASNNFSD